MESLSLKEMLQRQEEKEEEQVVVCLQAQRVARLPPALDGRPIQVECLPLNGEALACAHASSSAGVAVFHGQVLLLHCGPLASSSSSCFTLSVSAHHPTHLLSTLSLDLSYLYRRPSPIALAHGDLLTLSLHHCRVGVALHPRSSSFCCFPLPPPSCFHCFQHNHHRVLDDDDDSAGFITIHKHKQAVISRLPPSDDLFSTDDDDDDKQTMEADSSMAVEDEFLAMLDADSDLDLDLAEPQL